MLSSKQTYKSILCHICGESTDQGPVVRRRAAASTEKMSNCTHQSFFKDTFGTSAYSRDDFNLLFVFQQVVDNLVKGDFLNVRAKKHIVQNEPG